MTIATRIPLAKKLTQKQRMNYPVIRHLNTEQTQTFHERMIAGNKIPIEQLSRAHFDKKTGQYRRIDPEGILGTHATFDFGEVTPEIGQRILGQLPIPKKRLIELLSGNGLLIDGIGVIYKNSGLAQKIFERIEIIARRRKLKYILLIARNPIIDKICTQNGWVKYTTIYDRYYLKTL